MIDRHNTSQEVSGGMKKGHVGICFLLAAVCRAEGRLLLATLPFTDNDEKLTNNLGFAHAAAVQLAFDEILKMFLDLSTTNSSLGTFD